MSFKSGSQIMGDFIDEFQKINLEPSQEVAVYRALIEALWNHDWDCENDFFGDNPNYDRALRELRKKYQIETD